MAEKKPVREFHWVEEKPHGLRLTVVACTSPRCDPFTDVYAECQVPAEGFDDPTARAELEAAAIRDCDLAIDRLIAAGCQKCGQPFYVEVGTDVPPVPRKLP